MEVVMSVYCKCFQSTTLSPLRTYRKFGAYVHISALVYEHIPAAWM